MSTVTSCRVIEHFNFENFITVKDQDGINLFKVRRNVLREIKGNVSFNEIKI